MKKKLLMIAMSLCMVLTCMPQTLGTAFAAETGSDTTVSEPQPAADREGHDCGYKPITATLIHNVDISENDSNIKYSESPTLNALPPIVDLSNDTKARYGKTDLSKSEAGQRLVPIYEKIRDGINQQASEIVIKDNEDDEEYTIAEVTKVYSLVREDYPEFFWLSNTGFSYRGYTYTEEETTYVTSVQPKYLFDSRADTEKASITFNAKMTTILEALTQNENYEDFTDYDKEQWIHDWLVLNNDYILTAKYAHTAYGALVAGQAVCEGYTRAFQLLLSELGIESCTVTGSSKTGENAKVDHIWNAVKLDDAWYQVDVTWDDQGETGKENNADDIAYSYFNITAEEMSKDHTIMGNDFDVPTCNSDAYWYYTINARNAVSVAEYQKAGTLDDLAFLIADFIKYNGYARIYVTDENGAALQDLYSNNDDASFRTKVGEHMYINGGYSCSSLKFFKNKGETIIYLYPDEYANIVAADIYDWFCQEDDQRNVVIRAYPLETSLQEIIPLIKLEKGNAANQDNKCLYEATIGDLKRDGDSEEYLYYTEFCFKKIPSEKYGEYQIAMYKPGCPVRMYRQTVEGVGKTLAEALDEKAWWLTLLGDVNEDWKIDYKDALLMKRHYAEWKGYENIDQFTGDINGNGTIDLEDIMRVERHIAGYETYKDLSQKYGQVS